MKLKEFNEMMKDSFGDRVISIPSKTDNVLIKEFMGVVFHADDFQYYSSDGICIGNSLQYQTSWDWLMPVIKKCFCTGDNTFEWDAIMDAMWTCDIKIVHSVVVEFIKEHNKTI